MPRKNLIRTNEFFYHITTRSNNGEWFGLPLNEVWEISKNAFDVAQSKNPAIIYQYVLMSNHYHLLIQTPNCDIDKFMFWFNRTFSLLLREKTGNFNRMFGSNYKWSLITHQSYFKNVFCYIYQNPMRAGIVKKCEHYPYSTLFYSYHKLKAPFSYWPIKYIESDLELINKSFDEDKIYQIKKGLRKTKYKE